MLKGEDDSLYAAQNIHVVHHLNAALRAHAIYQRDVDYIVRDGEVIIVDEFTGRTLPGRRWSDGLHQAVEAKEGVPVQRENQTLAIDHLPEPVPHVRQAVRHDRHGGYRSLRIPEHLRPGSGRHPDPPPDGAQGPVRPGVPQPRRQVPRGGRGHPGLPCERGQPVLVGTTSIEVSELLVRAAAAKPASRTKCSTPSSTSAKRTSSPRPAARARSPSPPTWPAAVPTSCSAVRSKPSCTALRRRRAEADKARVREGRMAAAPRRSEGRRRPAHRRHRTPRIAPHRQPAARPFRPPGRPGFLALLPVARRQPDAHLRRRLGADA